MQGDSEPLYHLRDGTWVRIRRAVQHLPVSEIVGAALRTELAGGTQRLVDNNFGVPRVCRGTGTDTDGSVRICCPQPPATLASFVQST